MKILVTGGAGFIGSNFVRFLIGQPDVQVLNFDKLTYAGNLESLSDIETNERYKFVQGDICDVHAVNAAFTQFAPDAVIHLAAESHVDRSIDSPSEFIQTNLVGTFNMLEAARKHYSALDEFQKEGFRFLHVSTDEVYGSLSFEDDAFDEAASYDPHSPYSASKAGSDHLVRAWRTTYKLPVLITNCSNNYGPFQFPEKLIPVVILNAIQGDGVPVYGNGLNVRDWLYVVDHAAALHTVLTKGRPGETYNIGGNNERSNLELVTEICGILDELVPPAENKHLQEAEKTIAKYEELITFVSDRPGHDLRYAINGTKISTELGWTAKENMASGLRKTVQWYLDNMSWSKRCLSGEYKPGRLGSVSDRS